MPKKTERLAPDDPGFRRACEVWAAGGLVAFPTETVYGLGADARSDRAVTGIYTAKERPSFNPLIVHVPSAKIARQYVNWTDQAEILASAFWPGPLTLVLPLRADTQISKLVTAGLDSLAVRVPAHPVARDLLRAFQGPVAAPSANPSGRISPTAPEHVLAGLEGRIDAVVDAGTCDVGLESTIVGLTATPTLLRPGGLPREAIEAALGHALASPATSTPKSGDITAPGQLMSHYAPRAPIRLNANAARNGEVMLGFGNVAGDLNLSPSRDLTEAAANLFAMLHALDARGAEGIAVATIPDHGLGAAINDRLKRAAAPRP